MEFKTSGILDVDSSPDTNGITCIDHVAPFCLANGRVLTTDGTRFLII
jgi:hypothetical protein